MATATKPATDDLIEEVVSRTATLRQELSAPGSHDAALVCIREIRRSLTTLEQELVGVDDDTLGESC